MMWFSENIVDGFGERMPNSRSHIYRWWQKIWWWL